MDGNTHTGADHEGITKYQLKKIDFKSATSYF